LQFSVLFQLHKLRMMNLENLNSRLSSQVNTAKSGIKIVEGRLLSTIDTVNSMKKDLALANSNMQTMAGKFELQIRQLSDKSNSDYLTLSKSVSNNNWYWIFAIISLVLFATLSVS
jgi:amino acid permease